VYILFSAPPLINRVKPCVNINAVCMVNGLSFCLAYSVKGRSKLYPCELTVIGYTKSSYNFHSYIQVWKQLMLLSVTALPNNVEPVESLCICFKNN